VITIPHRGSTNVPVTSVTGLRGGRGKLASATVAHPTPSSQRRWTLGTKWRRSPQIGKPGTQAFPSGPTRKPAPTNIKVTSDANIFL
jgi:hypothetical protein